MPRSARWIRGHGACCEREVEDVDAGGVNLRTVVFVQGFDVWAAGEDAPHHRRGGLAFQEVCCCEQVRMAIF